MYNVTKLYKLLLLQIWSGISRAFFLSSKWHKFSHVYYASCLTEKCIYIFPTLFLTFLRYKKQKCVSVIFKILVFTLVYNKIYFVVHARTCPIIYRYTFIIFWVILAILNYDINKSIFYFTDTSKQSLERRFLASDTLQTVLDYLTIEGFHHEEYKVLSSWPRRDVSILTIPYQGHIITPNGGEGQQRVARTKNPYKQIKS